MLQYSLEDCILSCLTQNLLSSMGQWRAFFIHITQTSIIESNHLLLIVSFYFLLKGCFCYFIYGLFAKLTTHVFQEYSLDSLMYHCYGPATQFSFQKLANFLRIKIKILLPFLFISLFFQLKRIFFSLDVLIIFCCLQPKFYSSNMHIGYFQLQQDQ